MSVLDRASLEQSPLADLHAIASELSLDGYRRLRKAELIDAILERQGGEGADGGAAPDEDESDQGQPSTRRRRGRRGGRGRAGGRGEAAASAEDGEQEPTEPAGARPDESEQLAPQPHREAPERPSEEVVEGIVELLPNGSGFVRVDPPDPSDGDVSISAAQVKRCELVSGDRVSGPRRPPRRSERFASLVRVDTVNGQPAAELADGARFQDLPATFPSERFRLESEDLTITATRELAPIGRGSRVTIAGAAQSGKTEVLRRLAGLLSGEEELQVWLVLVGVRPEEVWEWRSGPLPPVAALTLGSSPEAQGQAVETVIDQAQRLATRGANTVVLIDSLGLVPGHVARRALGAARKLIDGGSLTVIATAPAPLGGETTVIALDAALARTGQFPALEPAGTWTMRGELLAR